MPDEIDNVDPPGRDDIANGSTGATDDADFWSDALVENPPGPFDIDKAATPTTDVWDELDEEPPRLFDIDKAATQPSPLWPPTYSQMAEDIIQPIRDSDPSGDHDEPPSDSGHQSEQDESVAGELAPITLLGGDWSEPGAPPDEPVLDEIAPYGQPAAESVLDEIAPYGQPAAEPAAPVPDAEKTSPAPGSFNWIWLVVPVVGAALSLGLLVLMGGSDENLSTPSASVEVPTDEPSTEIAIVDPSEDVEVATTTTAVTTTTAAAALFPPEDYGPCHIHPEEDATTCRPHYDLGVSETSINNFGDSFYTWETIQTFMGPVPVNPELPIEYSLVIESTNGQQIEHVLSGGPGEPITCLRRVNGVEAPLVAGEICGEFTAPDRLTMLIDVSAFAPGTVSWVFSTLETEPDGTRHGDWVAGGGHENFELRE